MGLRPGIRVLAVAAETRPPEGRRHGGRNVVLISPRVTVIVIFRDEERFLLEALDSVVAQTYDAWELLLVDDGSTDGSVIIAKERAAGSGGRIRYLTHSDGRNHGMSASRNRGLAEARGEYVSFLDADDVWLPDKLADQVRLLDETGAGLVYGRIQLWRSWQDGDGTRDSFEPLGVEPDALVPPPALAVQLLRNRCQTPTTSGSMLRRDVAGRVGGFEAEFRGMYEDQVISEGSVPYADGRLPFLLWVTQYLETLADADPAVSAAARQEIFALCHPWLHHEFTRLRRFYARPSRSNARG